MSEPGAPGRAAKGSASTVRLEPLIARNTLLNVVTRVASLVGWVAVAPFILARLGPERFGFWSILTVISGLYLTFDFGLSQALTKFVAEFRATGDARSLRGTATLAALFFLGMSAVWIGGVVAARNPLLAFFRVGPALHAEAFDALLAAAVVYALMNLWTFLGAVLTGLHRMDVTNVIALGVTTLQVGGVVVVLHAGGGLRELLLSNGVAFGLGALVTGLAVRRLAPEIRFDWRAPSRALWTRMTRYSAALQTVNVGVLVQFQLPKILFVRLLSLAAAGSYELGYRVALAAWTIPQLTVPPLLPAVSHLDAAGDYERIRRLYRRASRYLLALAYPAAAGLAALSSFLFAAWLGPGHGDSARAAAALAAVLFVNVLTTAGSVVVRGIGKPGIEARYHLLAMSLHLPLGIVLVRALGFNGGLLAVFVAITAGTIDFLVRLHRQLGEPLGRFLREIVLPPALISVVSGAVAAWIAAAIAGGFEPADRTRALWSLAAGATVFGTACAGCFVVTRYVTWNELRDVVRMTVRRAPAGADEPAH